MKSNLRSLVVCATVCLLILFVGCGSGGGGGDSSTGTSPRSVDTGSVAVVLADGPADDYDHIYIWVTEVSLIPAARNAAPATIFKTNKIDDGHRGLKVDLLEFRDEDFVMTVNRRVPVGKYEKIRLEISAIETVGGPCDNLWVKLPSGKIDLNPREPFQVIKGGTLSIRLDIDADKSINLHEAGNSGKCIFRPVVFVDIEEGAPVGRCPKIVEGRIIQLIEDDSVTESFVITLDGDRGELKVEISEQTVIFDEEGIFSDAGALAVGQKVKVRGKLDDEGVLVASLIVVGDLMDITGAVESSVHPMTNLFLLAPFEGEELTDDLIDVKVQPQTLILLDCDTSGTTEVILPGMKARVFGKYGGNVLSAVTIILQERRISGTILELQDQGGGKLAIIDDFFSGLEEEVFIPPETSVFLVGGRLLSVEDLCVGQEVRVVLEPTTADPLTAKVVFIKPEKLVGEVVDINYDERIMLVDADRNPGTINDRQIVSVPLGAKILKSEEDDEEQKEFLSFDNIEVGDFIVYFGLTDCQDSSVFNAFVIIVVEEWDDDEGGDDDDYLDYLPRFVLDNNVYIRLRAGAFRQSLTVRGNNFQLFGQVGPTGCGDDDWTVIGGAVEVYGNNARFRNIKFLDTVRVPGKGVEFINCCFNGGAPIYSN